MVVTDAAATAAATEVVRRYAPGAPDEVRTAAVALVAAAIQTPPFVSQIKYSDQEYQYVGGMDIIRRSGASSLLASYRVVRARPIQEAT